MKAYLDGMRKIQNEGYWQTASSNGAKCLTVPIIDMVYTVDSKPPIDTTRKINPTNAFAELIGYLRGVTSAAEMRKLGAKTWDGNANHGKGWLSNPNRKGEDDMGDVYGKIAKTWPKPNGSVIDTIHKVYNNLKQGIDDRDEIISFRDPGRYHLGCLRPCMFQHHFTIVNYTLHLSSYQRSADWALGVGNVNMLQVYVLLRLFAQITGLRVGDANHRAVNCHIYENQLELSKLHVSREPLDNPDLRLWINPEIKTLEDIETWVTADDFRIHGYDNYHPIIKYPLTV